MNNRTSLLIPLFLLSLLSASALGLQTTNLPVAAWQATQATTTATSSPVTIPFELNGRHILLKGKVNEKPITFVLDTGDQVAIVDSDVAQRLNLKLSGEVKVGGAGSGTATFTQGAQLKSIGCAPAGATKTSGGAAVVSAPPTASTSCHHSSTCRSSPCSIHTAPDRPCGGSDSSLPPGCCRTGGSGSASRSRC